MTNTKKQLGRTDVIHQEAKLYIEGVQVPFINMVVSQGYGTMPSATIQIPAQAGLMDIARFYRPKVHIFYTDRVEKQQYEAGDLTADKVLFIGHIVTVQYMKSTEGYGQASIIFQCAHKNALVSKALIDYSGWLEPRVEAQNTNAANKADHANSGAAILEALKGIEGGVNSEKEITLKNAKEGDVTVLPSKWAKYINRLIGIPGIAVNYWNQLKRSAYNVEDGKLSDGWLKMYQPLIEDGLLFFERMSGHYPIERDIENSRMNPCDSSDEILVPPSNRLFLTSAIQAQMAPDLLRSYLQTSGELTDLLSILNSLYEHIEYDMITLASPAEAPLIPQSINQQDLSKSAVEILQHYEDVTKESTSAVETIIKPKTPFYYSPNCNVFLPGMYTSIQVNYDEATIPTRIDLKNIEQRDNPYTPHFRAPDSIRKAIAGKAAPNLTLINSEGPSRGAVGKFEQGIGVEVEYLVMPPWLAFLSHSQFQQALNSEVYPDETKDPSNYQALKQLEAGWKKRYPNEADIGMNPWSKEANIPPHHRLLFAATDYYYTRVFARSKSGSIECPFNPYPIPGYPMDIIETNPNLPSFHAMCTAVTHNISNQGISTSVQFTAANTYTELANYYLPFIFPYLQVSLGLAENPTILNNNAEAKALADSFYYTTIGVKSVAPEDLYDFSTTALPIPLKKDAKGKLVKGSDNRVEDANGGDLNPYLTYEGNLSLTSRPIETKKDIEDRFKIKFIDLTPANYSTTAITYVPKVLEDPNKLEIGQSQFLDYSKFFGE